jgi:hypothetical protein
MAKRSERTHLGQKAARVSDLTVRSLDRQTQLDFHRWEIRFLESIRTTEQNTAWETLGEAGCSFDDLDWALYCAIDEIDTARSEGTATSDPARFGAFHEDAVDALRRIRGLRPALHRLMEAKLQGEPLWYQFFGLLDLPTKWVYQFWKFQYELALFEARLKQLTGKERSNSTVAELRAKVASSGAATLHVYIKESTGSFHHEETSFLLEAAAEAYMLEDPPSFALDAVCHRYTRFRKKHRKELEEIQRDIAELWSERFKGRRVDLIPFLMARRKARFQLLVRDCQKISGAAAELNTLETALLQLNRLAPQGKKIKTDTRKMI